MIKCKLKQTGTLVRANESGDVKIFPAGREFTFIKKVAGLALMTEDATGLVYAAPRRAFENMFDWDVISKGVTG